ncbi:MAG: dTMP kinase [Gemmatimonas sp.]|nr:dTMP kinase [Gemmatimonas sp.]
MTEKRPSRGRPLHPIRGGLFLAFEGVEGSGKSTQAALLAEDLRQRGFLVDQAREPGTTRLGERVRSIFLDEAELGIPARSELFLMLAARAAFVDQVVRPALQEGKVLIADRFELSTLAYQGAGRGLSIEEVIRCNRFATDSVTPQVTFLLELPSEEGVRRQAAAAKRPDRMEREAREFHEQVARGYASLSPRIENVVRIEATGSIEEVRQRVSSALSLRFPETFAGGGVIS